MAYHKAPKKTNSNTEKIEDRKTFIALQRQMLEQQEREARKLFSEINTKLRFLL